MRMESKMVFVTFDGEEFADEQEAKKHEELAELEERLRRSLPESSLHWVDTWLIASSLIRSGLTIARKDGTALPPRTTATEEE